jgi:FkbM family methyltransferase
VTEGRSQWGVPVTISSAPAHGARRVPALSVEARTERRARFLQLVTDSLATHLADNVDYLFHPWGVDLPAAEETGARLAAALDVLERADAVWASLGDDASRDLLLRFLAYRALGPAHVRLQLQPGEYRRSVMSLNHHMQAATALRIPGFPLEWQMHLYDFTAAGMNLRVVGPPLPLASTLAFSQYAYRDESVPARPRLGDVVLDIGGCWGETALWLANGVGEDGFVHTFEPTPKNRHVLAQNLTLNPGLASRIAVWSEALGDQAGQTVRFPDVLAAAAGVQQTSHGSAGSAGSAGSTGSTGSAGSDGEQPTVDVMTETVDRLVASGRILPPSFVKIDVEGAELSVLTGAADTIAEHRPVLAIAIYHRPDDLVAIPDFIDSLGVRYRWYLQCSTMTDVDTVAFAVPDGDDLS